MSVRLLSLLCAFLVCGSAAAQGTLSITIERGRLRLDGHRVPDAYVPPTLDLRRMEGYVSYTGPRNASLEIGGLRYQVDDGRLVLDRAPVTPPDVVLSAGPRFDLRPGGYVFVPVDWVSDPAEAERLRFATQQEFALDASAEVLAQQIRQLAPDNPQRVRMIEQLRATLDEAFEVKHRNRLREIDLLEAELRFLRKQQQKRNRHREEVIEHRLRELLAQ